MADTAQTNTEAAPEAKEAATILGGDTETTAEQPKAEESSKSTEAPKAPDKYEFKLPDGYSLDENALKSFEPTLKELGVTQENAQKLVDKYAELQQAQDKAAETAFNEQVDKWFSESKADKEFGGALFDESMQSAQKAIGKYGTPQLKELLNQSGLGNHPEIVRFCVKVGKALREDNPTQTAGTGGAEKSIEERLWPKNT